MNLSGRNLIFYFKGFFFFFFNHIILNHIFHLHRAEAPSGVSNFKHSALDCYSSLSEDKRNQDN